MRESYQWYGTYPLISPTLIPRLLSELGHAVGGYGNHRGGVSKHMFVTQLMQTGVFAYFMGTSLSHEDPWPQ